MGRRKLNPSDYSDFRNAVGVKYETINSVLMLDGKMFAAYRSADNECSIALFEVEESEQVDVMRVVGANLVRAKQRAIEGAEADFQRKFIEIERQFLNVKMGLESAFNNFKEHV